VAVNRRLLSAIWEALDGDVGAAPTAIHVGHPVGLGAVAAAGLHGDDVAGRTEHGGDAIPADSVVAGAGDAVLVAGREVVATRPEGKGRDQQGGDRRPGRTGRPPPERGRGWGDPGDGRGRSGRGGGASLRP